MAVVVPAFFSFLLLVSPSLALAQQGQPFSEPGGCETKQTRHNRVRRVCHGSIVWPDRPEELSEGGDYAINVRTVTVEATLDVGDGSGCGTPQYTYDEVMPGVYIAVMVAVGYAARSSNQPGTSGTIQCRVSGRYYPRNEWAGGINFDFKVPLDRGK